MREIEFRAWLKNEKKMVNVREINFASEQISFETEDDILYAFFEDVELIQYTGLKDKNGVKIFEGDVVSASNYKNHKADYYKHQVVFREGELGSWKLVSLEETSYEYTNLFDELSCKLEVIGNIYENPELLEM